VNGKKILFLGLIEKASEHETTKKHSEEKSLTEAMKIFSSYLENLKNCEGAVELIEGVSLNFIIELVIG